MLSVAPSFLNLEAEGICPTAKVRELYMAS